MRSIEYLADGHHVDDAGNLIACTYVDFRDPAERFPIPFLRKVSSKRHAIPECETIRISKPSRFLGEGGLAGASDAAPAAGAAWVYCASMDPETPEQQAARRAAMPASRNAVSPIRRPQEFARALGAMVAEQAGPRGRIVVLRSAVYEDDPVRRPERASSELSLLLVFLKDAARRAQREYRFAVWAEDEPVEDASSAPTSPASRVCHPRRGCRRLPAP